MVTKSFRLKLGQLLSAAVLLRAQTQTVAKTLVNSPKRTGTFMASVSMTASFLGGAATRSPAAASHRRLVITNSVKVSRETTQDDSSNGRREIIFAAAAAAISAVAGVAMAAEPKRGTPEAKKAYGPVCVANPTAKICNY